MTKSTNTENAVVTTNNVQIVRAKKQPKETINVTNDQAVHCNSLKTTSDQIRFLQNLGYKPGQIANALGIRPQHAYNVMNQVLKRKS